MSALTDFLLARIWDDESIARVAERPTLDGWRVNDAAHVMRHDPTRVLAECAAKRAIVEHYATALENSSKMYNPDQGPDAWSAGYESGARAAALELAAVWSDHPEYDPAWWQDA